MAVKNSTIVLSLHSKLLLILLMCVGGISCIGCSVSCIPGEYLVQVDANSSAVCVECPSGFYCEGNQSAPQACLPGTANQITAQINSSACQKCAPGTFGSQAGLTSCLPCPDGFSCPNFNITSPIACNSGFYAVSTGNVGATNCTECPVGAYCPFTFSVPIPCASGFYSNETQSTNCTECLVGHYCPDPSLTPLPCTAGFYAPAGSSSCIQCPEGTECPSTATTAPQPCSLGQYSFNASCTCTTCPMGHFCPDPVLAPTVCPQGTYNNDTGQIGCVSCEAGRQCLDGTDSQPCPAGTFSLELQVDCAACGIGSYSVEGSAECLECPAGHYCSSPGSVPLACQAGHVAIGGQDNCTLCDNGLIPDSTQTTCINCPAGHFCSDPRQSPVQCSNGTYSLSGANTACTPCPQGYACPEADALPLLCAVGTYSPLGSVECLPCPAGSSCLNESLPQPCSSGEYSLSGDPLCTICPSGSYCPSTIDVPSPCPSGTFSNESSVTCTQCPPGSYCPSTTSLPIPCPTGTYSIENATACLPCLAGFACVSTDVEPLPCDVGYYSGAGDTMCTLCPAGFQCPVVDLPPEACQPGYLSDSGSTNCTVCPPGHACPDIDSSLTVTACTSGTYSTGMQQSCTPCPVGMYCPDTHSGAEFPCEPGSYSPGNQTSCMPCPAGMACATSDGSSNVVCVPGTFSIARSVVCVSCPVGYACPMTDQALEVPCLPGSYSVGMQTECTLCPAGMECPFIDQATMVVCSPGHYSLGNQTSCTACPPGYECPSITTDTMTPCVSGYYSLGGADACTMCNRGFACPDSASQPTPCLPGTYSLDGAVNCTLCDAGHTCQDPSTVPVACPLGMWSPTASLACQSCDRGYQCLEASTTPTPVDQICSIGGWCDGQDRFLCPVGFYGNITGAGSQQEGCTTCPPSYFCPNEGGTSFESNLCPEGFYCPLGTTFAEEFPCPAGTLNNQTGQTSIATGCTQICPTGMFCPQGSSQGQECPSGFFCPEGTPSAYKSPCPLGTYGPNAGFFEPGQCIECPAGYYCPSGNGSHPSVAPLPCRPGTYNPLNGTGHEFNCLLCTAGMSCPTIALTVPSHTCNEGHYCPNGTIQPNQYPCPPGTFTFRIDLQSPEQCDICPAGQACGWGTGFNFSQPLPCAQGHYCPLGTPAPNKFPCPPGTFTELSNLTSAAECSVCPVGHYCIGGGAGPTDVCPRGHYCPEGTRLPHEFPCSKTTYNPLFGQNSTSSCLNCTVGHFCENGFIEPEACPAGTYMPFGYDSVSDTVIGEPIGNKSDCLACPGGQSCAAGSVTPVDCGLGMYSPPSSEFCFTCLVGHVCDENVTSENNMRLNKQCPPGNFCAPGLRGVEESQFCNTGFYCPQATPRQISCPPGTYNPTEGQSALSDCLSCDAGYYCLENATTLSGPCQPGYYCPTNISNGQLSRGIGSYGPTQIPCPGGTYQENFTSVTVGDCVECPQGNFCVEGSDVPAICPMGFYCIAGLNAAIPCPLGTIGNDTGLIDVSECVPCPSGQFCDSPGLVTPRGPCDPGFVCYLGANTSTPLDGISGESCPAGGYCPLGSSVSLPCPPGTFSNTSGSTNTFDCTECTPGFFCSNARTPEPTGPCSPGYYCPGGAKTPNDTVTMAGHFTPAGSAAPIPCSVGTWMPHTAAGECLPCTAGHYCPDPGSTNVTLCPIGHFCIEGSFDPDPCPPSTYNNQTGISSSAECLACPPGSFCATGGLTQPEGLCQAGFVCFGNSSLSNPIESAEVTFGGLCPVGHYCPEGSGGGIPCPVGTFSSSLGLAAEIECIDCSPGMHCNTSGLTEATGLCDPGYLCYGRATTSTPTDGLTGEVCPLGHFCEAGSSTPTACASGTYATSTGFSVCLTCPPSHFCHLSSTIEPAICPQGFYCPGGNGLDYNACPVGTIGTRAGLADVMECVECPAGSYCNSESLTAPSGICEPGYFCSSGATNPRPLDTILNGPCPAGSYCPQNSSSPTPCPPGTYSNSMFNVAEGDCLLCDPGSHCNELGLTSVSGLCAEGYYCINGSSTAFPFNSPAGDICPLGHFCSVGSSAPSPCLPGFYSNVTGAGTCLPCLAGFYCEGTTEDPSLFPCPPGYYCPQGTQFPLEFPCPLSTYNPSSASIDMTACLPCPAGFYCNDTGLDTPTGACDAGSFCDPGSTSPSGQVCQPGYYCPLNAIFQLPCPPGEYCLGFGNIEPTGLCDPGYYCDTGASIPQPTDGITGDICPMGHYCMRGSSNFTACPPGTFGEVMQARNESEGCEVCLATMYCGDYGLTTPSGVCAGGYYCPPGQTTSSPFDFICPFGHFCLSGILEPMRCPSGTYQDELGQTNCKECPASFFCDNRFEPVVLFNNSVCPQGYFCPNGTTFATEYPCPMGTFSNITGLASSLECLECTPGQYCGEPGLTAPSGPCFAGYFCLAGELTPSPIDTVCPSGHYCPTGTPDPIPCPAGTHSSSFLNQNVSDCTSCSPGHYCPQGSVNSTALECNAGFVCLFDAFVPNPVDNITGYACPPGHFCVGGALVEEACLPGSYQPNAAQSNCIPCPVGTICSLVALVDFTFCLEGHYCPMEGMTEGVPCPVGTYSNTTGNTNITDCLPCPRGMYCDTEGLTAPTGLCSAGFLCVSSSTSIAPDDGTNIPCPAGFYCVEGNTHPQPCPVGTLAPFSNVMTTNITSDLLQYFCDPSTTITPLSAIGLESVAQCVPCIGGFYCGFLNSTLPTGPCSAGYYCPHNASISVPEPGEFICPVGHFCVEGSIAPIACPATTYSDTTGAVNCTSCPEGHFCTVGTIDPFICPPHSYCLGGSSEPILCPNGTYTSINTVGLFAPEQCILCIAGHFCLSGEIAGECTAGHLCYQGSDIPNPNGSDITVGDLCPEGFYCTQGAVNATPCPLGLFNIQRGGRQVEDCTDCPPGRVCSGNVATLCPAGSYCTSGTPIPCPVATYNPFEGASVVSDCIPCEPGYLCSNVSTVTFLHTPCPVGHYCLEASVEPILCPQGTHRNETTAANVTDCYPCPAQFYCPDNGTVHGVPCNVTEICLEGTVTPSLCPAGFYCPQTDMQLPCPPGYYCPEGSAWFIECPRDHYCTQPACEGTFIFGAGASRPEICPLGYREVLNLGENFTRGSLSVTCEPCPAGTYMNSSSTSEDRTCFTCPEGHYCFGGSLFGDPDLTPVFNASICPPGHYCEAGSSAPMPCGTGTYSPLEGESNSSVCLPCPLGSFNHLEGQRSCFNCSSEANTIVEGSVECICTGANRRFQPSNGRCPCAAGFMEYDGRTDSDCDPIVYPLCAEGQFRSQDGVCRTLAEWEEFCVIGGGCRSPELYVDVDRNRGVCVCGTQVLDDVCDPVCQLNNIGRFQIQCTSPQMGVVTNDIGNQTFIELSNISGLFSSDLCGSLDGRTLSVFTVDTAGGGFRGNYMPDAAALVLLLTASNTATNRKKRQAVTPQFGGIDDPLVCLEINQFLFFFLSNSSYPVYDVNNLLNSNADADLGFFNQLVEDQLLTGDNLFFAFQFTTAGVFSFYLSDAPARYMYVRVLEPSSQCPEIGPFYPASPSRAVQLGIVRSSDIIQDPNWPLIGGLLGGAVFAMVAMVIALLFFRRYGWSKPVISRPKYRRSNKRLNMDHYSSKGSALMAKQKLHPLQELVDSAGDGVDISPDVRADEFWDYDGQVDLEAFSSKQLYCKLADQSHRVVASIGGQKEQAKALYTKLQTDTDSLKSLWVAKLNLGGRAELATPDELRAYDTIREKYMQELERRKALGQQFGCVLKTQLQLLEGLEEQRKVMRVKCESFYMEATAALKWLEEPHGSQEQGSSTEIERVNGHVQSLLLEYKTVVDSHCTQLGLTMATGARLVAMETGELLSLEQIQDALSNENESVVVRDSSTGLVKPGSSTRVRLPTGVTKEVSTNHFIDLSSGFVLPIAGNVHFDPASLKLVLTHRPPDTPSAKIDPLIPFIPYPVNTETGELIETGLELLEHPSQLKLNGPMKDSATGLRVPICAVTIHPQTKSLLPVGGTYRDPVTDVLIPIEIGSPLVDSDTSSTVPILGVGFEPNTGKVIPLGGSVELQDGERKVALVGEQFTDSLSEELVRVSALSVDGEVSPVAGDYQTFLDCTEMVLHTRLVEALEMLHELVKSPNEQQDATTEQSRQLDLTHEKLALSQSNAQAYSLRTLHRLTQRISQCDILAENGGSPCQMEYKPTGQSLPLLIGYSISEPSNKTPVPVLDYEMSTVTGIGEPLAGTMESSEGIVPITVGAAMWSEGVERVMPVVGVKKSSETGVVVPVPQDPGVFRHSKKRKVEREVLLLLEEELIPRKSFWRRSVTLLKELSSSLDQINHCRSSNLNVEEIRQQLRAITTASTELTQMTLTEKQRYQLSKSELVTRLPPDASHLLAGERGEEFSAADSHSSSALRFEEVIEKLLERMQKEEQSYQNRVHQATEANNPEAERQLASNYSDKMASLHEELKTHLLSQRQLLYNTEASFYYQKKKTELSSQLAKSVLTGQVLLPSSAVGYHTQSKAGSVLHSGEYGDLVRLVERLVQLVEHRGGDGLLDGELDEDESTVAVRPPVIPQLSVPVVNVEEVQQSLVPPWAGSKEGKKEIPPSVNSLGVPDMKQPVMSSDAKQVAKQMIEKHTIENINLENRLREKENTTLKKLYAKIEESKAKVIADSKQEVESSLADVKPEAKEEVLVGKMKELQQKLDDLEAEKKDMLDATVAKLVEERVKEKESLMKTHESEAKDKKVPLSHLVDSAPVSSDEMIQSLKQLAEQEEKLRAEINLEQAKSEEERLQKEEALRQSTMSRHIVEKLKSLDCTQDEVQQQEVEIKKLDDTLTERRNVLKKRVSSVINARGKSRSRRSRQGSAISVQQRADNALVELTVSEIAKKEALKAKESFGRETLINNGGKSPRIYEILKEFEREVSVEGETEMTVERKEAIAAMKEAQQRLQLEIKKDQQHKEQLKLSRSKQADLGGYSDTVKGIPDVNTETDISQERKQELLDKQLKDQFEVDMKHKKEQSEMEHEAEDEQTSTLARHNEESSHQMESSLRKKEMEFQQQLAGQQGQLSMEESDRMIAEHQREFEALRENLEAEQEQQKKVLSSKIAERRRKKADKLAEKQKLEMDKLLVEQAVEREQLDLSQMKDVEKETLDKLLKDKDPDKIESIVYHVLKQRHFEETVQLAAQYEREKALAISEKKAEVAVARQEERESLVAEQEKEMIELIANSTSISNADHSKQKLELKKQHKKQLTEFDRATQDSIDKVPHRGSPEKELQYNSKVLELRERQIKELAEAMSNYSPEQALVDSYKAQAEKAAAEAERYRKEVIESREEKIAKLKEERRQKEEVRRTEREKKLRELEAEIEREKQKDRQRQDQLKERYQLIQQQRIAEQEAAHKTALDKNAGISDQERQKIIDEHKESMRKMLEGMEQEKQRQVDKLEAEIKRRRERKEQRRREQLEAEEAKAVQADEEEEQRKVDEVTEEGAKQLKTKLARTRRPSTPYVEKPPALKVYQKTIKPVQDKLAIPEIVENEESEINKLIMSTPLFTQLSEIEELIKQRLVPMSLPRLSDSGVSQPYIDIRDAQWECKGELVSTDVQALKPSDFVVYRFGVFSSKLLTIRNDLPQVAILIADNLPQNNYFKNCYRNSFFYEHSTKTLHIRKERLESVGEFVLVILHCMAHIKCGDLTDDNNPLFLREFYASLRTVCQELFFSRVVKTSTAAGGEMSIEAVVQRSPSWDNPEQAVEELVDMRLPKNASSEVSKQPDVSKQPASDKVYAGVHVPNSEWDSRAPTTES